MEIKHNCCKFVKKTIMARIIIDIPESKLGFFMELIQNLGFAKVADEKKHMESIDIPETHQKVVMDRFNNVRKDPGILLDWDKAKKTLKA
jgi:hypothetical protein